MFGNSQQSSETTGNKELKIEKKLLEEEVGILGIEHEKVLIEVKTAELMKKKIGDNKVEFEKSNKEKESLDKEVSFKKSKLIELADDMLSLEKKHSMKIANFNSLMSDKEEELTNILSSRQEDIGAIEKRLSSKTTELEDLNTECDIVKEKKADFETDITALKEDVSALEKTNEKVLELKVEEDSKKKRLASLEVLEISLKKKVVDCQTELLSISSKVAISKTEADKFISENKGVKEKFDKEMNEERAIMDKREGLASEKEGWLQSKTNSLRQSKTELEKHFGKKINHIII